jgi:hypothetical protein
MITRSISRELKKISTNHYSSRCRPLTSPIINLDNQYQSHKYNDQLCVFDEDNELIADYNSLTPDFSPQSSHVLDTFPNSTSYNQDDQLIRELITDTEIINHSINNLSFDLYQENITNANEIIQTISNENESTQNTESNLEIRDS